jgi:phosphoserine aminotransferase
MPDAYDQGGYYLEVCKNGTITNWRIDKNNQDIPNYLIAVCDSMQHYLDVLE